MGDVLDLGDLVVVRQDDGVALRGERAHLLLERSDVVQLQRRGGRRGSWDHGQRQGHGREASTVFA